jgi:hypothetical protein
MSEVEGISSVIPTYSSIVKKPVRLPWILLQPFRDIETLYVSISLKADCSKFYFDAKLLRIESISLIWESIPKAEEPV